MPLISVFCRELLMRRTILFFVCYCFVLFCSAQDSMLINRLLQRIASQQIVSDNYFTQGNFPSYISHIPSFKKAQKDDNIFFAALINYTLQQPYGFLSLNERLLVDSIRQKSADLYKHFQNKNGRITYNFWRTDTLFFFPYTKWIHRIKKNTSLPNDMDDTVLSLMAQNVDSIRAAEVHALMQKYTNTGLKNKTIERKYRQYKTYSVWYGKSFPPVYDVCVLSNILSFVQRYHLRWTDADSNALTVIIKSIQTGDYINKPMYVSPYYGSTSLIIYHLARLMSYGNLPQLETLKTNLLITATNQLANSNNLLQKIILSSAIMKLGYVPPDVLLKKADKAIVDIEQSDFSFFIGNIPSYFSPLLKHFFIQKRWLLFYHYSPAFNDALLLEYLLLKQRVGQ